MRRIFSFSILACLLFVSHLVCAEEYLDESYLAGKDAPMSFGEKNSWHSNENNRHFMSVTHALILNANIVFIKPKELSHASYFVRKKLSGRAHLTDIIIDKHYLAALSKEIYGNNRAVQIQKWIKTRSAPILTALIIPGDIKLNDLPSVTTVDYLAKMNISWLIKRPYEKN